MFGNGKKNGQYDEYGDYSNYDNSYNGYNQGNYNSYDNGSMYNENQQGYQNGNQGYNNNIQNTGNIYGVNPNNGYQQDYDNNYNTGPVNVNYQNNMNDYQKKIQPNGYNQNTEYIQQNNGYGTQQDLYNTGEIGYTQNIPVQNSVNTGYIQQNNYNDYNTGNIPNYEEDIYMQQTGQSQDDLQPDDYYDYDDGLGGGVSAITPNKSHSMLGMVVSLAIVAIIGILVGKLSRDSAVFADFWNKHIYSSSILTIGARVLLIIIIAYIASIVHIILHQLGHLFGGTVTNYSAVSFRVFSITFVKDGQKTRIKRYNIPGTAGECIMMPPENANGKYPFMLYNLGGILMNFIASLVSIVLYLQVSPFKAYPKSMCCVMFTIVGLITIIYNGIPLIINGVPNDGYTIMQMLKSYDARNAVHSNLLISAYLARGGRYSEIPYDQFYINTNGDYDGHLAAKVKLKEYRWHLEQLDFAKAAECLNSMDFCFRKLPRIYQYEINSEKLFLEIIGNNNPVMIEKLYNIDIKKYLEETQGIMSTSRTMMAYEACVAHNMKAANKQYIALKNGAKTEPLKGEVDLELMLGQYIYESFCANSFPA